MFFEVQCCENYSALGGFSRIPINVMQISSQPISAGMQKQITCHKKRVKSVCLKKVQFLEDRWRLCRNMCIGTSALYRRLSQLYFSVTRQSLGD